MTTRAVTNLMREEDTEGKRVSIFRLTNELYETQLSPYDLALTKTAYNHKLVIVESNAHGFGVFTLRPITKNEAILCCGVARLTLDDALERVCSEGHTTFLLRVPPSCPMLAACRSCPPLRLQRF